MYDNANPAPAVRTPSPVRHRTSNRRRSPPSTRGYLSPRKPSRARPLPAMLAVLAFAVAIHFIFPHFSRAVGDKVTMLIDYRTASAIIADGITGDRAFREVFGEAWAAAFHLSDNAAEDVVNLETPPPPEPPIDVTPNIAPAMVDVSDDIDIIDDVDEIFEEEPPLPSFAEAAMAAFAESQYSYADYMVPTGVAYDMPTLGISGRSPTDGVVSSGFGYRMHPISGDVRFHYGTDFAAPEGTPIYAFADGRVSVVGTSTTLGNYIIISHDNGEDGATTTYGHCGEVFFSSGDMVTSADKIASVSQTGNATGPCLHFELKIGDVRVNPQFYIDC